MSRDRYTFDDLLRDEPQRVRLIGAAAEQMEQALSQLTGAQLAAWGDRIGDPMRTLLEMRSVAICTRIALEEGE